MSMLFVKAQKRILCPLVVNYFVVTEMADFSIWYFLTAHLPSLLFISVFISYSGGPAIFNFYVVVNRFFSACSGQDLRITHSFPHPNYRIAQWCGSVWISIRIRKFSMTIRIRIRNFSIQIQGKKSIFNFSPKNLCLYRT